MKRLCITLVMCVLVCWQTSAFAQDTAQKSSSEIGLMDPSNQIYTVTVYYEIYTGVTTSSDEVVLALQYTEVVDPRPGGGTTSDFTAQHKEDMARLQHLSHSCLSDENHVGVASIKYNCFAYAYGITHCHLTSSSMRDFINAGDLNLVATLDEADLVLHRDNPISSYEHASEPLAETVDPPDCSASKQLPPVWYYKGKLGVACTHKLSLSCVGDLYTNNSLGYYAKTVLRKR